MFKFTDRKKEIEEQIKENNQMLYELAKNIETSGELLKAIIEE